MNRVVPEDDAKVSADSERTRGGAIREEPPGANAQMKGAYDHGETDMGSVAAESSGDRDDA
jgi:hypothetical protein